MSTNRDTDNKKSVCGFTGLTEIEAEKSRLIDGSNQLSVRQSQTFMEIFIDTLKDPWLLILIGALVLKLILCIVAVIFPSMGNPEWIEILSLAMAIILASGFSSVSTYNNEKKFSKLQAEASVVDVKVIREGVLKEISINDIVKDDIVLVQTGDPIPADGIILKGKLKVNQATLNGESEDAIKSVLPFGEKEPDREDLFSNYVVFRGTTVTDGEAHLKVTHVGDKTILGSINTALQEDEKSSPTKEKLEVLAGQIGKMGYTGGTVAAVIDIALAIIATGSLVAMMNTNGLIALINAVMLGVTVVIMAVPEGLPMMLSLVSAMNGARLLSKNILVRNNQSIETAGYMNILFSDKTGTITEGKLTAVEFITGDGEIITVDSIHSDEEGKTYDKNLIGKLINGMYINNDAVIADGNVVGSNATDRALLEYVEKINIQPSVSKDKVIDKKAFSSTTKFASVQYAGGIEYIKGASEVLVKDCDTYFKNGNKEKLTDEIKVKLTEISDKQASRSMRILALIQSDADSNTLVGLVCIRDNVRADVPHTVDVMNKAGVQVVMVTGDRKETAVAIAKESNILKSDDDIVLTHDELEAMIDEELMNILHKLRVVSRALPMDKKRLVDIAQKLDMVPGMTGDGVNDSPALKSADVGFSMGDGTSVAKEASDIVILNNSLTSIKEAIVSGRTMSKSVKKFIIFQLTVNVTTIVLACLMPLLGLKDPFNIVQILYINLIMDTLAALAFGQEPVLEEYMDEEPIHRRDNILTSYMKKAIGIGSAYIIITYIVIFKYMNSMNHFSSEHELKTFGFAVFIYAVIFNLLNTRSKKPELFKGILQNRNFIYVFCGLIITQTLILTHGGDIFGITKLPTNLLIHSVLIGAGIIPIMEVFKIIAMAIEKSNKVK